MYRGNGKNIIQFRLKKKAKKSLHLQSVFNFFIFVTKKSLHSQSQAFAQYVGRDRPTML